MTAALPSVWMLPRHATSWVKMLDIARLLAGDGRLRPVMVFAVPAAAAWIRQCEAEGIAWIDVAADIAAAARRGAPVLDAVLGRLGGWMARHDRLANDVPVALARMVHLRRTARAEAAVFAALLRRERPVAVLMPGDRELSPVPAMLKAAADAGIPTIVAAFGSPYTEGLEHARRPFPRFKVALADRPPLLNLVAARLLPGQVRRTAHGPLLFSPGWLALALHAEGMLSANPWIQGGGNSRYHFQTDRTRMEAFIRLGAPAKAMVLVGDLSLDLLHDHLARRDAVRRELAGRHGLAGGRPLVVMSVPNDAEHDVCGWDEHLARMEEFLAPLGGVAANVVLSLHPKSDSARYRPLADRHGLAIADRRLYEILPAADLYVCSGSSTVGWARLCAVPVINLDYLGIRDGDYLRDSIVNVETPGQFRDTLDRWLAGTLSWGDLGGNARRLAEDCLFDGHAGDRIRDFLCDLAARRTAAPANEDNRP